MYIEVTQEKDQDDMIETFSFQKFPNWEKESESGPNFLGCTSGRCHMTTNRSLLPKVEMFDAIIFDQFHTHWDDLPTARCSRAGPKGLRAESARAVTGRRCPHSGVG